MADPVRVQQGSLGSTFRPAGTAVEAVAAAEKAGEVTWIGISDPSLSELEDAGRAIGIDARTLARVVQRRKRPRSPRARVTRLQRGTHVVVVGWELDPDGGGRIRGQLEVLAVPGAVAVLGSDLPAELTPAALLAAVRTAVALVPVRDAGDVLGLVLSEVLDAYEKVLDALEDDVVKIVDDLFANRQGVQLQRISQLARPVHAATVATQPLAHGLQHLAENSDLELGGRFIGPLRSEVTYVAGRLERIDALLDSAQQTYFNLAQDEANRLASRQGDVTRKMSGYALLIAIPTIVFSLYGTNFEHVPLLGENWGYGVMLAFTVAVCVYAWRKLRTAGWL